MVDIPTAKTQLKVAELLHEMDGCQPSPFETCPRRYEYIIKAAHLLGHLMPEISKEMFPAIRADERDKVAYYITAELVCCDIHARLEAEAAKGHWNPETNQWIMPSSWVSLRKSTSYHDICHFGGWAASLAYHGPELDQRHEGWFKPWLVNGTIEAPKAPYVCKVNGGEAECKPIYWCPTAGEYESPCHGGFDTCCRRPQLHRASHEHETG